MAPTNISEGKDSFASTSDPAHLPAAGNDGSASTYWQSTNTAGPEWWKVDLGSSYPIVEIILYPGNDGLAFYPIDYVIEGSNDDLNWNLIATVSNGSFNVRSFTLAAYNYRFVKLTSTVWDGQGTKGIAFREFEAYTEPLSQYERLKRISPGTAMRYEANVYIKDGKLGSYDGSGLNRYLKTDNLGHLEIVIVGVTDDIFDAIIALNTLDVLSATETVIASFTVPPNKKFHLKGFRADGTTSGLFRLYLGAVIPGNEIAYCRSSCAQRDGQVEMYYAQVLTAGTVVTVTAYHWLSITRTFNVAIMGALRDISP